MAKLPKAEKLVRRKWLVKLREFAQEPSVPAAIDAYNSWAEMDSPRTKKLTCHPNMNESDCTFCPFRISEGQNNEWVGDYDCVWGDRSIDEKNLAMLHLKTTEYLAHLKR